MSHFSFSDQLILEMPPVTQDNNGVNRLRQTIRGRVGWMRKRGRGWWMKMGLLEGLRFCWAD